MRLRSALLTLLLPLAACQQGAAPTGNGGAEVADAGVAPADSSPLVPAATPDESSTDATAAPAATSGPTAELRLSCEAQIGATAATALAKQCRAVSPATRPPCNAANSCALIRDEVARGCAMLGTPGAKAAGCVDPEGAAAAVAAVQRYYEAIAARDYGTAFALWGGETAGGQSRDQFARGFANTRSVRVTPGQPGFVEGAAGSRFVTIPVTVDATLRDGTKQRFTGEYRLRRVAPIEGATAENRRWHIDSATLKRG